MTTVKYAPSGQQLWAVQSLENSSAKAIAVDNNGGIYITGSIPGGYLTVRYDGATGEEIWSRPFNAPDISFAQATAIAVDGAGGVFVTGFVSSSSTSEDYATIRYDAATGQQVWVQRYNGQDNSGDAAAAIAIDNEGGVVVTGTSNRSDGTSDFATVRYDAATGQQAWVSRYEGEGSNFDWARAIATDNSGNVYVTGLSFGESTTADFATIRYEAATGQQIWVQRDNGSIDGYDDVKAIAVDNAGGVYVTGNTSGIDGATDVVTVRYAAATGQLDWFSRYDGPETSEEGVASITVDNNGGVYVTGTSIGIGGAYADIATIRYEAATGQQTWVSRYDSEEGDYSEDWASAIAVDNTGGVYVTGSSISNSGTFGDYVTLRYIATTGEEAWVMRFNGIAKIGTDDKSVAVAVDAAGNSYVTGTSQASDQQRIATVKYDHAGQQVWAAQFEANSNATAIAVDSSGGVYVTGSATVRYDAATGEQTWVQAGGAAIAVDNTGGVYVTGLSTARYDAVTGEQTWATLHEDVTASAIAVDSTRGIYVTGTSNNDYATVRFEATTGQQTWASRYDGGSSDNAAAIAVDNRGGVYVTGSSYGENGSDFATVRYEAATGDETWAKRYNEAYEDGKGEFPFLLYSTEYARAIAVDDQGGVYVTGRLHYEYEYPEPDEYLLSSYVTLRYQAATGEQAWVNKASGLTGGRNEPRAIATDNKGGVYVTGTSYETLDDRKYIGTVRYDAATGGQTWVEGYNSTGSEEDEAVDMAIDSQGNLIITGYRNGGAETGYDFITIKYSQLYQCPDIAEAAITGYTTVSSGLAGASYSVEVPGATTFVWQITPPDGSPYSAFSGQGTPAILVDWPDAPDVYKVSVSYSAGAGCPATTSTKYVYVYDTHAGFVTGGGWSDSPVNTDYELMQQKGRAYWAFVARYKESRPGGSAGDPVQGALLLVLESGQAFRTTSVEEGSLVIAGERAYFTGSGTLTRRGSGGLVTDPRRFAYLLSAIDGQLEGLREEDRLLLRIWVMNGDGSPGAVAYDSQLGCASASLEDNAPACQQIDKGSIVIHRGGLRSVSDLLATAAAEPTAQGLRVYPTAVSDRATVSFSLESASEYALEIYDTKGALVRHIASGSAEAGRRYEQEFSVEDMGRGLYLARLTTGEKVQTAKLVVER
ncbi:SBBP repeat-containing protein [Pontibacter saemangeumensis]